MAVTLANPDTMFCLQGFPDKFRFYFEVFSSSTSQIGGSLS